MHVYDTMAKCLDPLHTPEIGVLFVCYIVCLFVCLVFDYPHINLQRYNRAPSDKCS